MNMIYFLYFILSSVTAFFFLNCWFSAEQFEIIYSIPLLVNLLKLWEIGPSHKSAIKSWKRTNHCSQRLTAPMNLWFRRPRQSLPLNSLTLLSIAPGAPMSHSAEAHLLRWTLDLLEFVLAVRHCICGNPKLFSPISFNVIRLALDSGNKFCGVGFGAFEPEPLNRVGDTLYEEEEASVSAYCHSIWSR